MVLGLRSRHKKGSNSIQVHYIVHVEEIRPWPPSHSLRSVQSVLLKWEGGDKVSGSLISGVGEAKIEFNESFDLPVTLVQEKRARDKFQKNHLEFYLYEQTNHKSARGQLLGSAVVNLSDFGVIEEVVAISTPLNSKRSSKSSEQATLFIKVYLAREDASNSSPNVNLLKEEESVDKYGQESVSNSVSQENDDISEIASFTDDDVSLPPSQIVDAPLAVYASTSSQNSKDELKPEEIEPEDRGELCVPPKLESPASSLFSTRAETPLQRNGSLTSMSPESLLSSKGHSANSNTSMSGTPQRSLTSVQRKSVPPLGPSYSVKSYQGTNAKSTDYLRSLDPPEGIANRSKMDEGIQHSVEGNSSDKIAPRVVNSDFFQGLVKSDHADPEFSQSLRDRRNSPDESSVTSDTYLVDEKPKREHIHVEEDELIVEDGTELLENKLSGKFLQEVTRRKSKLSSEVNKSSKKALGVQGSTPANGKLKHGKSLQLYGSTSRNELSGGSQNIEKTTKVHSSKGAAPAKRDNPGKTLSDGKKGSRTKLFEEELREAAALEVSLYSIVAEHGSSANKVHAPARRLSRFYLHTYRSGTQEERESAARAAVSGLVLVSKACGSDVPRLTFWLSNSIMFRAIVSQAVREIQKSDQPHRKNNGSGPKENLTEEFDDWEDTRSLTTALEQVEAWIFSRIVESVWWQTMTPHMQSSAAKASQSSAAKASATSTGSSSKKTYGRRSSLGDQEHSIFAIELWKNAFRDARERLCPIRAGGHECGCLPILAKLVMEQLVIRLDVAMFNAILRDSAEEMPTDPISDPISDSRVLPIPAGKSSFSAGAQLKNAIGNWSRWLSDVFGIEDDDSPDSNIIQGDENRGEHIKPFQLLNALSDLMMVPFEMLADAQTRKEVCPTFGPMLIKTVLNSFVPDEFCPHPIPQSVLSALDSEDDLYSSGESLNSLPCSVTPTEYSPPIASTIARSIGEPTISPQRSRSSVLRKSHTSDDELDEVDSPLTSIIAENFRGSSLGNLKWVQKGARHARYQLLREIWKNDE